MELVSSLHVTAFGAVFLLLCLSALVARRSWLPALAIVGAVFQSVAVATLGIGEQRHGITPFNVACAFLALDLFLLVLARQWRPLQDPMLRRAYATWTAFLALAALGALVLPFMFEGVLVHALMERSSVHGPPTPLKWSLSNLAQAINCIAVWVLLTHAAQAGARGERRVVIAGFGLAAAVSLAANAYQRLAALGLVPLFAEFWGSNAGYNQYFTESTYAPSSFPRMALPFIEPSYAGVWFATIACAAACALLYAKRHRALAAAISVVFALALFNTLSTIGFLALVACVLALAAFQLLNLRRTPMRAIMIAAGLVASVLAALALVYLETRHGASDALAPLREAARWSWSKLANYGTGYRLAADRKALQVLYETFGLGAGAGSIRTSSYFTALLAHTGVIGFALFALALGRQWLRSVQLAARGSDVAIWVAGGTAALFVGVGAGISDQNWPVIWVCIGGGLCLLQCEAQDGNRPASTRETAAAGE